MNLMVRGGWLIPSERVLVWWNTNIARTDEDKIGLNDIPLRLFPILCEMSYGVTNMRSSINGDGPQGDTTLYTLVRTDTAYFDNIPPADRDKCILEPQMENTERVKRFFENRGLDLEESGTTWHTYRNITKF